MPTKVVDGELLARAIIGNLRDDVLNPDKLPSADEAAPRDHSDYLPIARYAKIPRENIRAFLAQTDAWFSQYILARKLDDERRQLKAGVDAVKKGAERLVYAFELLEKRQYGSVILNEQLSSRLYDEWPELIECMYDFNYEAPQSIVEGVYKTLPKELSPKAMEQLFDNRMDRIMKGETALITGLRHQVKTLIDAAHFLSTVRLPKRGKGLANKFIIGIIRIAEASGGDLSYDKNTHTGGLAKVYDFFHEMAHLHLSRSTLQRLKNSAKRLKDTR